MVILFIIGSEKEKKEGAKTMMAYGVIIIIQNR